MKRKEHTWIDALDKDIIPYIDDEGYETRYPTLNAYPMGKEEYDELYNTADIIFNGLNSFVQDICDNPGIVPLDLLNMTDDLTPYILNDNSQLASYIARLDFVKDLDGVFKLVEINADTPCAIPETYYGNFIAEEEFNKNFSLTADRDKDWRNIINIIQDHFKASLDDKKTICFAASNEYIEDLSNARYVGQMFRLAAYREMYNSYYDMVMSPLQDLVVTDYGVNTKDGQHIDVLYLLHPKELLINDTSEDGYPVGKKLLELANEGKVFLINPPKAILLQNKALLAAIKYIGKYKDILPFIADTALDAREFMSQKMVCKPIFGREGCDVSIIESDGEVSYSYEVEQDLDNHIYQKFIESKTVIAETDVGVWSGKYTYSIFVLGGKPSMPFLRFSPYDICGLESLWVPVIGGWVDGY